MDYNEGEVAFYLTDAQTNSQEFDLMEKIDIVPVYFVREEQSQVYLCRGSLSSSSQ